MNGASFALSKRPYTANDGLIVKDDVQKCGMDLQFAIVFDEAQSPKFVHEVIDPRPCGAHPRRQYFLIDLGDDGLHLPVLGKIGEQQEHPG